MKQNLHLSNHTTEEPMFDSFMAFIDSVINGKEKSNHPLNHFTSYNENERAFKVFDHYLNVFNQNYSISED